MRARRVRLENVRCFPAANLDLDGITVVVGANNAGKSTLLRAVAMIQDFQVAGPSSFVRLGTQKGEVILDVDDLPAGYLPSDTAKWSDLQLRLALTSGAQPSLSVAGVNPNQQLSVARARFPARYPDNPILPFMAARRQFSYQEQVNEQSTRQITGNLSNLAQRLQHLQARTPKWNRYAELCDSILGFHLTAVTTRNGLTPGIVIGNDDEILVDALGDGVPMIAWLVAELVAAEGKLILIEEPEHDLHPSSLKKLLDLMIETISAGRNQVLVTTHSHVVVNAFGAAGSLYRVDAEATGEAEVPTSSAQLVDGLVGRIRVLDDLGYSLGDIGLYDGWLILEEASAETVVKQLLEWFFPRLASRLRTLSAGGVPRAEKVFDDYNRLFLYLHLESRYKGRAWVVVDGDDAGKETVQRLRQRYGDWSEANFHAWSKPDFEGYYPSRFSVKAAEARLLKGHARQDAKRSLAKQVADWMREAPDEAKSEFSESAAEVREFLTSLHEALVGR